jgi:hypothetical protein
MPIVLIVRQVSLEPLSAAHRRVKLLHGFMVGIESRMDWKHSQEQAIEHLEKGYFNYFIYQNDRFEPLIIAHTPHGEKFLKARNDADESNALLELPPFSSEPAPAATTP